MTEERTLGGTCLNRGCLPSKNLIGAAHIVYTSAHPRYPGLRATPMTFNLPALVEQKDELIRAYRQQHYASLLAHDEMPGPGVVYGHATLVDPHTVEVRAADGSLRHLRGEQILIATGSSPLIPTFAGLAETPYLTIALEMGQMFSRFGTQVTLLAPSERILKDYEPEISQALTSILRQERIQVVTGRRCSRSAATASGCRSPRWYVAHGGASRPISYCWRPVGDPTRPASA